jgi:beta-xylosidase
MAKYPRPFLTLSACLGALLLAGAAPAPANPIIRDQFVADPSAHVFDGRVYLYLTNDSGNDGKYWNGKDWRAFSTSDMRTWKDHGSIAQVSNFSWAKELAWAPNAVKIRNAYYLIVPVERTKIGVLRSNSPTGPFVDHIGEPLIDKARDANTGAEPIDPAVFVDGDGKIYMAFGTRTPKVVELTPDLKRIAGPIRDVKIEGAPSSAPYGEAPWIHKRGGTYYFSYSTGWPGQIVYATGKSPVGPFTYRGVILDRMNTLTNHQALVDFKGKSYIFYHNNGLPGGGDFKRSTNVDRLYYEKDGSIRQVVPTGAGALPGRKAVPNPAK